MTNQPRPDLAHIIAPVEFDRFLAGHWGHEPLHVARNDPAFYEDLLTLSDVDRLLVRSRMTSQDMRLLSKERGTAFSALAGMDRAPADRHRGPRLRPLHDAFADGESLVVQMRSLCSPIDRLCRSAEQVFRRKASAELYLTPRQAQAFDVHYDLHDVFLLQLDGSKTWHIYEPVADNPSPLSADARLCGDRVGEPKSVIELRRGDLLYMPCGFPHQGMTSDQASLHITIGVSPLYVHDLLKALVDVAARDHPELRRPLRGGLTDLVEAGLDRAVGGEWLRMLAADGLLEKALQRLEDGFLESLDAVPDARFAELAEASEIAPETVLERRPGQLCSVRSDPRTRRSVSSTAW
jgi:hypothetical protein